MRIPVAKPLLPTLDLIAPYLRQIDANRWYSNHGPLVRDFESRLAEHLLPAEAFVVTVGNATTGIQLALMELAQESRGHYCMVPAWTFAATGHAIQSAGLKPWIVDVDVIDGVLTPEAAERLLTSAPGSVAAVVPVSPFGFPIDFASWEIFENRTGVPVVIDAAAAFDTIRASRIPTVVSLHATKVLGVGEGGFVVCSDRDFIERIRMRANFGFYGSRDAQVSATNGKLSEYAAAVGLAALDAWPETRARMTKLAVRYTELIHDTNGISIQHGFGENWVSWTPIVSLSSGMLDKAEAALGDTGIGTRRWYGRGLHRHRAFTDCAADPAPSTDQIANRSLGLPFYLDMPNEALEEIVHALAACL